MFNLVILYGLILFELYKNESVQIEMLSLILNGLVTRHRTLYAVATALSLDSTSQ